MFRSLCASLGNTLCDPKPLFSAQRGTRSVDVFEINLRHYASSVSVETIVTALASRPRIDGLTLTQDDDLESFYAQQRDNSGSRRRYARARPYFADLEELAYSGPARVPKTELVLAALRAMEEFAQCGVALKAMDLRCRRWSATFGDLDQLFEGSLREVLFRQNCVVPFVKHVQSLTADDVRAHLTMLRIVSACAKGSCDLPAEASSHQARSQDYDMESFWLHGRIVGAPVDERGRVRHPPPNFPDGIQPFLY